MFGGKDSERTALRNSTLHLDKQVCVPNEFISGIKKTNVFIIIFMSEEDFSYKNQHDLLNWFITTFKSNINRISVMEI